MRRVSEQEYFWSVEVLVKFESDEWINGGVCEIYVRKKDKSRTYHTNVFITQEGDTTNYTLKINWGRRRFFGHKLCKEYCNLDVPLSYGARTIRIESDVQILIYYNNPNKLKNVIKHC